MVVEVRFGVIQEGVLSHGSKWPPEATKGKKTDSSPENLEGNQTCQDLGCRQLNGFQISCIQNYKKYFVSGQIHIKH